MLPCNRKLAASLAWLTAESTLADKEERIEGNAGGAVKALLLSDERLLLASEARLAPLFPATSVRLAALAARALGYRAAVSYALENRE